MKEDKTKNQDAEFEAAVEDAAVNSADAYTHVFKKPILHNGTSYDMLTFDFGKLTAKDSLDVEAELQAKGIMVMVPTFSGPYLIGIAARACTVPIGIDAFERMSIGDYNRIRSKARNFLLSAEQ